MDQMISAPRRLVDVTMDNFMAEVIGLENNTTIVQFWAPWCGPCKQPVLEKVVGASGRQSGWCG